MLGFGKEGCIRRPLEVDTLLTLVIALGGIATGIGAIWAALAARRQAQVTERSLVHLGENNPSASDLEWAALVGPLERHGHRSVEVLDELEDAPVQILHGGEVAPLEEPARQNREP